MFLSLPVAAAGNSAATTKSYGRRRAAVTPLQPTVRSFAVMDSRPLKEFARKCGADLVGVAPVERFEGAPERMDPRHIFPDAKAVVVFGFRIPRGCFRGIEEGTYFGAYPTMGYSHINLVYAPNVLREVSLYLEDQGYEAVPVQNMVLMSSVNIHHGTPIERAAVRPGVPPPDVTVHYRLAAVAAGLGEIGYSKVFLSPEFGPRQRLALLVTDAPLEPDPLFDGEVCDRCKLCVSECPGGCLHPSETVRVSVGGKALEWAKLDVDRCTFAYAGGVKEFSPFAPPDLPPLDETAKDPWKWLNEIPYNRVAMTTFHHTGATGGAKGCIRACMVHLEQEGRIKARFHNPFRKRPHWRLPG
jgi:ferredoxin